jgi:N-acetylmuramic acid 6-phosphate etherase
MERINWLKIKYTRSKTMVDISKISTEERNEKTKNIDLLSTKEVLIAFNEEDKWVPYAVEKAIPQIADTVDAITNAFKKGGRLFYIGAGTSGRLGVLDASECSPTFGVPDDMVIGIIAGGDKALRYPIEKVEDSKTEAVKDLKSYNLSIEDFVIGITASGRTPYAVAAVEYANSIGCDTACITTSSNSLIAKEAKHKIEAITGAEPVTGSTRMKSGTAQKLILNMISTASMVKLGKVYENLMVDVQMSNDKLVSRAVKIVTEITKADEKTAYAYLKKYNSVKYAIFGIMARIDDKDQIEKILSKHNGNIRESLKVIQ